MDKIEYKIRAEEIKELTAQREFERAAQIADTIDWRRVKSASMLCTISDLYKINKRYEDARDVLLLAYDRRPGGRTICYSLCELSLKLGDLLKAIDYYREFVQVAPQDTGRYILQYKIYEAQDVSLEERIAVLEELKRHNDYREKWAYELAYLYHRVGLAAKCVEECDELILWFGEGKYVTRAMELKMLHQALSPDQQAAYDNRHAIHSYVTETEPAYEGEEPEEQESAPEAPAYDTAAAEPEEAEDATVVFSQEEVRRVEEAAAAKQSGNLAEQQTQVIDSFDIQIKAVDLGQYNTINLQEALAEGLKEILGEQGIDASADLAEQAYVTEGIQTEAVREPESSEVFFGNTGAVGEDTAMIYAALAEEEAYAAERESAVKAQMFGVAEPEAECTVQEEVPAYEDEIPEDEVPEEEEAPAYDKKAAAAKPNAAFAGVLSQESDGQISFVVPEAAPEKERIEKQITGQLCIDDILAEWEARKKENEEKRKEEVRRHVLETTGAMFTEFEAAVRDGLLEQFESGKLDLPMKDLDSLLAEENFDDILADTEAGAAYAAKNAEAAAVEAAAAAAVALGATAMAADAASDIADLGDFETEEIEEIAEPEEGDVYGEAEAQDADTYAEEPAEELETFEEENREDETYAEGEYDEYPEGEYDTYPEEEGEWTEEYADEYASEIADEEFAEEIAGEAAPEEYAEEVIEETAEAVDETAEAEGAYADAEDAVEEPAEEIAPEEEIDPEFSVDAEEPEDEVPAEEADEADAEDEPAIEEAEPEAAPEEVTEEAVDEAAEAAAEEAETKAADKMPAAEDTEEGRPVDDVADDITEDDEPGENTRALTREEKELFGPFIQSKTAKTQLIKALDAISMAAYTGNVVVTGDAGLDLTKLAQNIIREVQTTDSNMTGKAAQISGNVLNKKDVSEIIGKLKNGALIIEHASAMNKDTVDALTRELQQDNFGIVVVLVEAKKSMSRFLKQHAKLAESFTARVEVEALSNAGLVAFGKEYAREREYAISDVGVLALHTIVESRQTLDHAVTIKEVKQIIDEAIEHTNKKTWGHFMDVLLGRRYDDVDMVILTEKDFS